MKKYYAVKKGRETGIFYTWPSCEAQIKGFSGAEYKSFKSLEDAKRYLDEEKQATFVCCEETRRYPCAYIDGSYDAASQRFSYGAVILLDADKELHFSEAFEDESLATMRNVAGEIKGSEFAISYALSQAWPEIAIYYDYSGIEKWATGAWKRNLPATQDYFAFCQNAFEKIKVRFIKVKGHSGNTYNDLADSLARRALNL
ncbi:MAG: ribonuclease H family protein [Peptococcaceae bacterium]|nr:ribonuclease H family protein [Peptococcaceae bacterium]